MRNKAREGQPVPRMEPVPDNPAGENVPYRGAVDHGVPFTEPEHIDEAHYHTGRPVEYLPEQEADKQEPVPVIIVREGVREIRTVHTVAIPLMAGQPSQILARDDKRLSASMYVVPNTLTTDNNRVWVNVIPRQHFLNPAASISFDAVNAPEGSTLHAVKRVWSNTGPGTAQIMIMDTPDNVGLPGLTQAVVSDATGVVTTYTRGTLPTTSPSYQPRLNFAGTDPTTDIELEGWVYSIPPNDYIAETGAVYISPDSNPSQYNGFKLTNIPQNVGGTEPLFAMAPNGATAYLLIETVEQVR